MALSQRDTMARTMARNKGKIKLFGVPGTTGLQPMKGKKMTPTQIQKRKRTAVSNAATKAFSNYSK